MRNRVPQERPHRRGRGGRHLGTRFYPLGPWEHRIYRAGRISFLRVICEAQNGKTPAWAVAEVFCLSPLGELGGPIPNSHGAKLFH
jgi:hypothetical protein